MTIIFTCPPLLPTLGGEVLGQLHPGRESPAPSAAGGSKQCLIPAGGFEGEENETEENVREESRSQ